jgi:carbon monoxide dehydrogenase subunit G
MKLEQSFEVDAPLERVWQTLVDVEHVAPCLPGAAVTGRNEDGSYNGTFTVKIGPTTASYTGKLEMESIDESSHTATMQAQGTDKRGQGGAKATIFSRLAPADGRGTRVEVVTDYHITGRLARFGRGGMIEDISERLLREFAKRLQSELAAQQDTLIQQAPAPAPEPEVAPTAAGESEAPVSPVAPTPPVPSAGEPEPARDETVFAQAPADEITPPRPEEVPRPEEETQPGEVSSPVGLGADAPVEPPAPPPPPSPGPPPVATPPAAEPPPPHAGPSRPPLEHPPAPSEPLQGLTLVGGVLWSRVKRNPAPVAAAGVAVMLLLAGRRRRRH